MKRVLVTGGAGFVGSHLCAHLIERGDYVICMDDFSTGSPENVAHLAGRDRFRLIRRNVRSHLVADVDLIFNLACPASPPHYQADPIGTTLTCVLGTYNVLDLARRTGARVVQASTSEVYGDPEVHPQREDYLGHVNSVGPRACYDEGKRTAESLCADFRRAHGVSARIARIFNTYGPQMHPEDGRVVSNFIVQALRGEPLTVYGDGLQTRSFCYVDDLVEGLIRLADVAEEPPGPVNLGNPAEFTVSDLAHRVIELACSTSMIERRPLPVDDPRRRRPDITRARELLGWGPSTALDVGLLRTIRYFEGRLAARAAG